MNSDWEYMLAEVITDYLKESVSDDIQGACPIVTFFDPMSVDDASRIVVRVPSFQTDPGNESSGWAEVELVAKSQWTESTVGSDFDNHRKRVQSVRDCFWTDTLVADLNATAGDRIGIDFVHPERSAANDTGDAFTVNRTNLKVHFYGK